MSNRWPDVLRITLCPDQVVLERGKPLVGFREVEYGYFDPEIIPVEPRHEPTLWAAPLAVLGITLDGLPGTPHDATVVLSNHFVHYPLIPARTMGGEPESIAGDIDDSLRHALRELLARSNCRMRTLQSRLQAFGSSLVDELPADKGWIVMVEEGLAAVGLVQDGKITRCRNLYLWPSSAVEILSLLDKEAARAGLWDAPRDLLLWKRDESDEVVLPPKSGWRIVAAGTPSAVPIPSHSPSWRLSIAGAGA